MSLTQPPPSTFTSSPSFSPILHSFQYYFVPLILLLFVILPQKIYSLQLLAFFYGGLPILDKFFSLDTKNPTSEQTTSLIQNNFFYELCLYTAIVVNYGCFYQILNDLVYHSAELSYLDIVGHLLMYGNIAAMGIVISHEIYHKEGVIKKTIGLLSIINTLYMHWTVQHVVGHHRNVATSLDPATASKNISFYQFYPRTVYGTWLSCYHIQHQKGKSLLTNLAILSLFSSLLTTMLIYYNYSFQGALIYLIGGWLSFTLLQIVNYIEHYGLLRKQLPTGEYQRVNIRHSWNTTHRFTNYFFFKLQRHSDHHENSYKPYQVLLTVDESPHMPQGYTAMLVIALFPKVFFEIMNPLLEYYEKRNKGEKVVEMEKKKAGENAERFMMRVAAFLVAVAIINRVGANWIDVIQGF